MKLAKSVSAFANTDGGRLLIGVRDDGHISGVRSEEEIYMMEKVAAEYCKPASAISFDTYIAEGRTVVVANIPRAARQPVFAINERGRKTAYVRIKDENIAASPVHLEIWKQDKASTVIMTYNKDETQLIDTLKVHPGVTLNRLVRLSGLSRYKVIKSLARFIRYDIATMKYQEEKFVFGLSDAKNNPEP
ncbi:MAG: helix-turn-helix domain-containing protein [Prevotella sp.]|jgi:predicted HTH transcriptional regulator